MEVVVAALTLLDIPNENVGSDFASNIFFVIFFCVSNVVLVSTASVVAAGLELSVTAVAKEVFFGEL